MADLTPTDYAFLILLKIEGREISNTEMDKLYGVRLVGENYARLNAAGRVDSNTSHRPYRHKLAASDDNVLEKPFKIAEDKDERSAREQQLWAALNALHNYHLNGDKQLPAPALVHKDLDERIRAAYAELTTEPGAWVSLKRLRPLFKGVPKADLDNALERLLKSPDVNLEPESNQKTLKDADRRAAVKIGGEPRHLLAIGMR
jgi:hypothetical protein